MSRLRSNFQRGSLSANAGSGDTSLSSGQFSALPVVASPDYLMIVLDPDAQHGNPEIVKVTAHTSSATSVTVVRAQEGTSARAHNSSTTWRHVPTGRDWSLLDRVFDVVEYGATGDNSTDDTASIQDAITDAMAVGGVVYFPYGIYRITSTLLFQGSCPIKLQGTTNPDSASTLRRDFDGDLLQIERSVAVADMLLYDSSSGATRSGAAIKLNVILSAGSLVRRAQYCSFNNVRVTSDDAAGAWERIVYADGSSYTGADGAGVRNVSFVNCHFFGCRTAGETIRIDIGTIWEFLGGGMYAAPTAVTQGIKVASNSTDDVHFVGFHCGGNFYTEANNLSFVGGEITGTCTTASSATNSFIHSIITGAISQGSSTNCTISDPRNVYGLQTYWNATSSAALIAARTVNDTSDRWRLRADGLMFWSNGAGGSLDTNLYRQGAGVLRCDQKLVANSGLGAGNSASGSTLGTVVKKLQIFDSAGNSLGYLPIYDAIT